MLANQGPEMKRRMVLMALAFVVAMPLAGRAAQNPLKGSVLGAGVASFTLKYDHPPTPGRAISWKLGLNLDGYISVAGRPYVGSVYNSLFNSGTHGGSATVTSPETGIVDPFILETSCAWICSSLIGNPLCEGGPYCSPGFEFSLSVASISCGKGVYQKLGIIWSMDVPCNVVVKIIPGKTFEGNGVLRVRAALAKIPLSYGGGQTGKGTFVLTPA